MLQLADAEHFVRPPDWTWYILFYFFLAGLSGGSYLLASLLRLFGKPTDEPAARVGYYVSFVTLVGCPVLLTLDLGKPLRFWHMLVNTTPGQVSLAFKYWSPMSVGAWALVVFGAFVTVTFVEVFLRDRGVTRGPIRLLDGFLGKLWVAVGAVLGLFIAGYTGVLLAVSNQPVWSDTWALGGLFLASGLTGSAALMLWLVRLRKDARSTGPVFATGERLFSLLELGLIVVFAVTLIPAGTLARAFAFPWTLLWVVAFIGLLPGLGVLTTTRRRVTADGAVAVPRATAVAFTAVLVLLGVLALRAAVIFSVQ
jgi:formate-dependent nitrite reductase membrane component NrfD